MAHAGTKRRNAIKALSALGQETRIEIVHLLARGDPAGLPASVIAERLSVAPSTLSFHLARLEQAQLIVSRRLGRELIYSADQVAMSALLSYLTRDCCRACSDE